MQKGNFSKKISSNLDEGLPNWITLIEGTQVSATVNSVDSVGGVVLKRASTDGSKTLSIPTIKDSKLTGCELTVVLNGLSAGNPDQILDLGFYGDASNYIYLRFTRSSCKLMYAKNGSAREVSPIYLSCSEYGKYRQFKIFYDLTNKTFEVKKNGKTVYLSLDGIDVGLAALNPIIRWGNCLVATQDKLAKIEFEKFYL